MLLRQLRNFINKYSQWHYCNIYPTAKIGNGTKLGSYTEIGNNVKIGKGCVISSYVFIPEGVEIEDDVFIGPKVCFTNDKHPPSKNWSKTIIKKGARIGANVTILPGIKIGSNSLIGAGSVVTKSVPYGEVWVGCPAHQLK